jgi:hypothetical protein
MYPGYMDALMPIASAPFAIAGRNRMLRAMIIDAIRGDPAWKNGDYRTPPAQGLIAARYALWMMTSSPLQLHKANPTRDKADAAVAELRQAAIGVDANDMLFQFEASSDYDPSPLLEKIKAPLCVAYVGIRTESDIGGAGNAVYAGRYGCRRLRQSQRDSVNSIRVIPTHRRFSVSIAGSKPTALKKSSTCQRHL